MENPLTSPVARRPRLGLQGAIALIRGPHRGSSIALLMATTGNRSRPAYRRLQAIRAELRPASRSGALTEILLPPRAALTRRGLMPRTTDRRWRTKGDGCGRRPNHTGGEKWWIARELTGT